MLVCLFHIHLLLFPILCQGHNKWSKIKYVKAKEDAKKGKVFARFAHEIMLAAKSGGGATELNNVCAALREAGHTVISMKLISVAQNVSVINDLETAKAALRLYEALDDYDDALNVFSNFDVAEEILEQLD